MRILRIGIRNLNSLRGRHVVDFTASPLAEHPLYAIVGPTGAGKTTILDAITLALYGEAERHKGRVDQKDGSNTVMTHGTGECRAEVDFEAGGYRYRSVWRRHRAYSKSDGNLQDSKHEISRYNPKKDAYDILATRKLEVKQLTEEVIGLSYDRFVRSVMLTQGEFDRFLRSNTGEKAEILEQITGTDIYAELSRGAFQRHKQAREAYERARQRMEHVMPLEKEARRELEGRLNEGERSTAALRGSLDRIQEQVGRYEQLVTLQQDHTATLRRQQEAERRWEALAEQRRQLADSDKLAALREQLHDEQQLQQQIRETDARLAVAHREAAAVADEQSAAGAAAAAAREALEEWQSAAAQREQQLCRAEVLDRETSSLGIDINRQNEELSQHQRTRKEKTQARQQQEQHARKLRQELDGRTPEQLEKQTSSLENELPEWEAHAAQLQRATEHRQLCDRLQTAKTMEAPLREELAEVGRRKELLDKDTANAELRLKLLQAQLEQSQLVASLTDHRSDLTDGKPCPLCGATHHPYALDLPETVGTPQALKTQRAAAEQEADRIGQRLLDTANLERELDRKLTRYVARREEIETRLREFKTEAPTESAEALQTQAQAIRERANNLRTRLGRLRELRPKATELLRLEDQLTHGSEPLQALDRRIEELSRQLQTNRESLTKKERSLHQLVGHKGVKARRREYQEHEQHLRRRRDRATTALQAQVGRAASLTERVRGLTEQQQRQQQHLNELNDALSQALSPYGFTPARARERLLDPTRTGALRRKLEHTERERQTGTALLQRATEELERARAAVDDLPPHDELRRQHDMARAAVQRADREIGELSLQLRDDDRRIEQLAELREHLAGLKAERDRWARMNELIGSADGKKFRSYAQAITLQRLVGLGNRHLHTINPRYRMQYAPPTPGDKEALEIEVVDRYMNDNRRSMSTLSGGESFLISLALALGLSDLASGRQLIQSLFIDEGFGTLDGKTLDQAMVTLEQLQAQGKTVGIISHVQQLRERVHCQIRVKPVGDGFSRIEVAG